MKFSDLQKDFLDVAQLATLKAGVQPTSIGCIEHVCEEAMETVVKTLCTDVACSTHAA